MDPLSQAAIGAAAAQSWSARQSVIHALWIGALAGMAPDLDVFIRSNEDPLLFLEYHRQFTHSLLFIPLGALICACVFFPLARRHLSFRSVFLFALLGYGTHGLLDACTTYGTQLLWPLTTARFAWHNVSVIDPLFTLPLVICVIVASVKHQPRIALAGFAWALLYLSFGLAQHQRALSAAETIVASRGHEPVRLEVKPGFANLLLWKMIYEVDGRYFVDAVRVGLNTTYYTGASVAKLDIQADFPALDPTSQQAQDIERFRWFSDDWLALDARDTSVVVDMRYSQLPNAIKGLWGIRIAPEKTPETHIEWVAQRQTSENEINALWQQLKGVRAMPLPATDE